MPDEQIYSTRVVYIIPYDMCLVCDNHDQEAMINPAKNKVYQQ